MFKIMTNFPTLFQHQEVFSDTIRNAESPVQKIFNSHIFSAWFGDDVKLHGQGPQTSSLFSSEAPFRFLRETSRKNHVAYQIFLPGVASCGIFEG